MSDDLTRMTAAELSGELRAKNVSATEVTQAHLDRIAGADDHVHAFLHVAREAALAAAAAVDARGFSGPDVVPQSAPAGAGHRGGAAALPKQ